MCIRDRIFRTRWSAINAGALTTHIGLLLLTGGSLWYFGTKTEGDILLRTPRIAVRAEMEGTKRVIAELPAVADTDGSRLPGRLAAMLDVEVLKADAASADVRVRVGGIEPRPITLTAGDWQPLGAGLEIGLVTYPAQQYFYDSESPAFYVRNTNTAEEVVAEIDGLPIYREHYPPDVGVLHDTRGIAVPVRRERPEMTVLGLTIPTGWLEPWHMPVDVPADGLPFALRVTAYVPFIAGLQPVTDADGTVRRRPVLLPREGRRADIAPRGLSAIRVEITGQGEHAGWSESRWCMFSSYPDIDANPIRIDVPGEETTWELIYSRKRHAIGAALTGRSLNVTYFPGKRGIESFHSDFEILADGAAEAINAKVSTNHTLELGPWTLFQSGYSGNDHWRYTILGVGNRNGIGVMNVGWILVTLGCLYAFYVKPLLLRRASSARRDAA